MKTAKENPEVTVKILKNTVANKEVVRAGDVVKLDHEEAKLLIGMGKAQETDEKLRRQTKAEALGQAKAGKAKPGDKAPEASSDDALGPDPRATQEAKAQKRG